MSAGGAATCRPCCHASHASRHGGGRRGRRERSRLRLTSRSIAARARLLRSTTAPNNRGLYHAALDQAAFVKRSTAQDNSLPVFWYPAAKHPEFASIQSMYYFGYTYLDLELPKVTSGMRQRLDQSKPQTIVMLCETRDCAGGQAALRRAGHSYLEDSAERISQGQIRLWSVLLRRAPDE